MRRLGLVLATAVFMPWCWPALPPAAGQVRAVLLPPPELGPPAAAPLDVRALWDLALANNPSLREAEAEVEAARGRQVQAGKYPNPGFTYEEESIGPMLRAWTRWP